MRLKILLFSIAFLWAAVGFSQTPTINSQPSDQTNVCPNTTVTFSVTATPGDATNDYLKFQWQVSDDGGSTWTDTLAQQDGTDNGDGTFTSNLDVVASQSTNGHQYRVVVLEFNSSDDSQVGSTTSNAAVLSTDNEAPTITVNNSNPVLELDASGQATLDLSSVASADDNCSVASFTASKTTFTCADLGDNTVTLTATDGSGNTTTEQITVTVEDNLSPDFDIIPNDSNNPILLYLNNDGEVVVTPDDLIQGDVTDNCGVADSTFVSYDGSMTTDTLLFTCDDLNQKDSGFVRVTDVNGNHTDKLAFVLVVDTIKPVITVNNSNPDLYLDETGQATLDLSSVASADDNCSVASFTASKTTFTCADLLDNDVVLTATDVSGNTTTKTITVTVWDTISPTITINKETDTLYLDAHGNATFDPATVATADDNCSVESLTASKTAFDCNDLLDNTVTITAEDEVGNTSSRQVTVIVLDTIKPVITVENEHDTLYLDETGQATLDLASVASADDNCLLQDFSASQTTFTCDNLGDNTVTLTAEDVSENTSTAQITVTVLDTIKPVITVENEHDTLYLDENGQATLDLATVASSDDNCSVASFTASQTDFTCDDLGDRTITLTAQDFSGNTTTEQITVTIIDSIAPTITYNKEIPTLQLDENGQATLDPNLIATADDNCSVESYTASKTLFTCDDLGDNPVILTAQDASGNTTTKNTFVRVVDNIAPTITVNNDHPVLQIDESGQAKLDLASVASADDNCSVQSFTASQTDFTCDDLGDHTITLTAQDASGNTTTEQITVTVEDNIAPTITVENDHPILQLDGSGHATLDLGSVAYASDNCDVMSFTASQTDFSCADLGDHTITLTAQDAAGNTTTAQITVTVEDNIAPTITINDSHPILQLDENGQATLDLSSVASANDNCTIQSFTASQTSFGCEDIGDHTITLTAEDIAGNVTTEQITVTVEDNTAPTITINVSNPTIYLDASGQATLDLASVASADDNCSVVSFTASPTTFTCDNLGNNIVTLTAQDGSGNVTNETLIVNVEDTISPVLEVRNLTVYLDETGNVSISPEDLIVSSSDNCGIASRQADITDFDCGNVGDNNVTVSVVDNSGNVTSQTAVVTVLDTLPPRITSNLGDRTVGISTNTCSYQLLNYLDSIIITDNCPGQLSFNQVPEAGTEFYAGDTVHVVITVQDAFGNADSVTFNVYVVDDQAPDVVCSTDTISVNANIPSGYIVSDADSAEFTPQVNDCSDFSLVNDFNDLNTLVGDTLPVGTTQIVWTATDVYGNQAQCSYVVVVAEWASLSDVNSQIAVYPNPAGSYLIVKLQGQEAEGQIQLISLSGKVLKQTNVSGNVNRIDLSDIPAGVYVLRVVLGDRTVTTNVIKQ